MKITKTLYVTNRKDWRSWLAKNHAKEKEIWLIYYRKSSGKNRIPYNDAVEEALCYGWIDSIVKGIDDKKYCQRFSPRKNTSILSALNKERIKKMIKEGKMNDIGLKAVSHVFDKDKEDKFVLAKDIKKELKKNKVLWENFDNFSEEYKRIRIQWIEEVRGYPELFKKRLNYFLKMTAKNKKFGFMK
jgi:uncharacterized protein YdeI (YjbR/CyaY-like superfamily)